MRYIPAPELTEDDKAKLKQVAVMFAKLHPMDIANGLTLKQLKGLAKLTGTRVSHCKTKLAIAVELDMELPNWGVV